MNQLRHTIIQYRNSYDTLEVYERIKIWGQYFQTYMYRILHA